VRLVQNFGDTVAVGLSIESPQAVTNASNNVPATVAAYPANTTYQVTGSAGGLFNSTTNYTTDPAPDLILKAAFDPGYGHYEVYGLGRWFRSVVGTGTNTRTGGGVGAGAILPIVGPMLSFEARGLAGKGIGRYGASQLADFTVQPNGELSPIKEYQVLLGLIYQPIPSLQAYLYGGREKASSNYFTTVVGTTTYSYGYGAPAYNNSGCYVLGGKCAGNPGSVDEVTAGLWWKYYSGKLGNLQLGLQAAYNQVRLLSGVGGEPSANVFEGEVSFRYYPYQK